MDELTLEHLGKWMNIMDLYMPAHDVKRLMSNEKVKNVLRTVISRVAPEERVNLAQRYLLLNHIKNESANKCKNFSETEKSHNLIKQYVKLNNLLKRYEKEFIVKKKMYLELVKEIEELIQEIQLTNCAKDEERKKIMFMLLNKQELQSMSKQWKSFQEVVHHLKEIQILKGQKENYEDALHSKIVDVLDYCQLTIKDTIEDLKSSSSRSEVKRKVVKSVSERLQNFPWKLIFEALLEQEKKFRETIETLCENGSLTLSSGELKESMNTNMSQKTFIWENFPEDVNKMIFKLYAKKIGLYHEGEHLLHRKLPVECSEILEELKLIDLYISDIDHQIKENIEEFRSKKVPLRIHLENVSKIKSQIKLFPKLLQESIEKDKCPGTSIHELETYMKQLTTIAPKEIKLFQEIPLVFLEKLQLLSGECVGGHELLFNHQKMYPLMQKYSKSSLTVLNGSANLTPFDVVLHLFQQLSYLGELKKTEFGLKPITEPNYIVAFKADSVSEGNKKLKMLYDNFVAALSIFESNIDDVADILGIMTTHPLRAIVPKDLIVEGTTLEYWENEFT